MEIMKGRGQNCPVSQGSYIKKIVNKYAMSVSKPVILSSAKHFKLGKD